MGARQTGAVGLIVDQAAVIAARRFVLTFTDHCCVTMRTLFIIIIRYIRCVNYNTYHIPTKSRSPVAVWAGDALLGR